MINISFYTSPIGKITLASKDEKLIGLWLENQKHYLSNINGETREKEDTILIETKNWLNRYFNKEKPNIKELELELIGTDFRKEVWEILKKIPYGETTTYKDIAEEIAKKRGISKMSAQSVGGAVGHNPISIIIPCHRVIGTNGNLTGYDGGLDKKIYLLKHEKT